MLHAVTRPVRRVVRRVARAIADRVGTLHRRIIEGREANVLLYHRVARAAVDPWGLAVSPERFAEQLDLMCRRMYPMSLGAFASARVAGALPRNAIAVTFDDGYVDNLHTALPLLSRYGVPATVFLATGYLGRTFWWDEVQRLVLGPHSLPGSLVLRGRLRDGTPAVFDPALRPTVRGPRDDTIDHGWRAEFGARDGRQAVFLDLWAWCADLTPDTRDAALAALAACVELTPDARAPRAMTADEVRALATSGLVEIGAHTVTHPMLSRLDAVGAAS